MHSKKVSFDQIFTAFQSFGLSELMEIWESRFFEKPHDISSLIQLAADSSEFLARTKSYILITDLKAMKSLYISPQFLEITGFSIADFSVLSFVKKYCQADGAKGMIIHKLINQHQKQPNLADKHLYLYTSNFRFLTAKGYYKWMHNRIIFIEHDVHYKPSLLFSVVTDIDHFKINDHLSHSRMKFSPISQNYELEYYEEFLPDGIHLLTESALKILSHLSNGLENREIAIKMGLSEHTIRDYRKKMLKKTWCSNTCELIAFVLRNKLI